MKIMKSRMITCYINKTLFYTRGIGTTSIAFVAFSFRCRRFFEGKIWRGMLSEECLASTAICTSRGDLDQTFFMKVWTLSKSHFACLKSKLSDFLAIYFLVYAVSTYSIYIFEL